MNGDNDVIVLSMPGVIIIRRIFSDSILVEYSSNETEIFTESYFAYLNKYNNNSNWVVSTHSNGIMIWDDKEIVQRFPHKTNKNKIVSLLHLDSYYENGINDIIATAEFNQDISLWSITKNKMIKSISFYINAVPMLAYDCSLPDILISSSGDSIIRIWDIKMSKCLKIYAAGEKQVDMRIIKEGKSKVSIVTAGYNNIGIWSSY